MYDNASRVFEVNIDEILPNRFQPRIQFDEEEILELSDSIKEHGVIQPIVVRTIGDKYEIIAGERRYKASVLAGKETVPVIIRNLNDKDSAEVALIENVQRKNLTPIEEALSYKKILDMGYITQENLASKLGKSQSAVANKIRLLNLSDEVQEALLENKISERHARSLLKLQTSKEQNELLNRIINERLTVRRTDEEIEKLKNSTESNDEGNSDDQKVIERGENNMNNNLNNNLFGAPNVSEQQVPSFDIFGTGNGGVTPNQNVQPVQNFDIFNTQPQAPVQNLEPQPTVQEAQPQSNSFELGNNASYQSAMPEMPSMPTFNFNFEGNNQPIPQVETPSVNAEPVNNFENTTQNMFTMPTMQPEVNTMANPFVQPQVEPVPVVDTQMTQPSENLFNFGPVEPQPTLEQSVPQTAPILETPQAQPQMQQPTDNLFNFSPIPTPDELPMEQPQTEPVQTPEFTMPEPIIVTDYSKQYDPVMPQTVEQVRPKVEFREVINAIRECSNKIEQYGFKIDVEEYDLANLYQVIFKIEKQ